MRSRANSAGGSSPDAREKGKLGMSVVVAPILRVEALKALALGMVVSAGRRVVVAGESAGREVLRRRDV